jgi:ABC-type dipeptide/oligopeptide/nickel transport system permease component
MNTFDAFFFHFFQYYKFKKSKKANSIATFYLTLLQSSLILLLGVFFAGFFKQMHVQTMSSPKAWTLFVLVVIFLYFKNWIQYSGKKRKVLNAKVLKNKKLNYNIWLLWLLPVFILGLTYVLYQAT